MKIKQQNQQKQDGPRWSGPTEDLMVIYCKVETNTIKKEKTKFA